MPQAWSETECKAIDMEMIFKGHTNKTHFHKKGTVLHFKPLWKWELLELGNGLLPKDCAQAKHKQTAFACPK